MKDPDARRGTLAALKAALDVIDAGPVPECFDAKLKELEKKK